MTISEIVLSVTVILCGVALMFAIAILVGKNDEIKGLRKMNSELVDENKRALQSRDERLDDAREWRDRLRGQLDAAKKETYTLETAVTNAVVELDYINPSSDADRERIKATRRKLYSALPSYKQNEVLRRYDELLFGLSEEVK